MDKSASRARRAFVGVWLLAAALLAGCGGGGADGAAPSADVLKTDVASFTGNGTYWNPAEPGTGFFFEAQAGTGVLTYYAYEASGRPVWYSAVGPFTSGPEGYHFSGELQRFKGGQSDASSTPATPTSARVGAVSVLFGGNKAEITLPQRSFTAERFYAPDRAIAATSYQPETGIYWNPAESGRGYTIEVNNDLAAVTVFHYADDGQPTWHLAVVPLRDMPSADAPGTFVGYSGGQTLSGPYAAPRATEEGLLKLSFSRSCSGVLTFPRTRTIPIQRFAFGSLAAGAECRTATAATSPAGEPPAAAPGGLSETQAHLEEVMLAPQGAYGTSLTSYYVRQMPVSPSGVAGGVVISLAVLNHASFSGATHSTATLPHVANGQLVKLPSTAERYVYDGGDYVIETLSPDGVVVARLRVVKMEKVSLPPRFRDAPAEFRAMWMDVARYLLDVNFPAGSAYYRRTAIFDTDVLTLLDADFSSTSHTDSVTPLPERTIEALKFARPTFRNWQQGAIRSVRGARCWIAAQPIYGLHIVTHDAVCELAGGTYLGRFTPAGSAFRLPDPEDSTKPRAHSFLINKAAMGAILEGAAKYKF